MRCDKTKTNECSYFKINLFLTLYFFLSLRRRARFDQVWAMELREGDLQHPEGGGREAGPAGRAGGRGAQGARHPLHPGGGRQGKFPHQFYSSGLDVEYSGG